MYLFLQLTTRQRHEEVFPRKPRVACVVEPQTLLEFCALYGRICSCIAESAPISEIAVGEGDLLPVLFNLDPLITETQDFVETIISDFFTRLGATKHFQSWPDPHRLGCAELPWRGFSFDEQGLIGLVADVQLSVELDPLLMADAQIVAGRAFEVKHCSSFLQHLGQWGLKPSASRDEGAVVVEQPRVRSHTGG